MKHLVALALALLMLACDAEVGSEANHEAPDVPAPQAGGSPSGPQTTVGQDPEAGHREFASSTESHRNRGIRLRLLSTIDEASLQNAFFHRAEEIAARPDGSMVIAHHGEQILLWFDGDHRLIRSAGKQGPGPGEFDSNPELEVLSNGVVVWDFSLRRLTFFSATGEFVRTTTQPLLRGRLLGLVSEKEAVFGGVNFVGVEPREYFGVNLDSGEITWRWTGPATRTIPGIRFATGTTHTTWGLPDCVPAALAGTWQGRLLLVDAGAGTIHALPIGALEDGLREEPIHRATNRPRMTGDAERYVLERIAAASPAEKAEALKSIVSEDGYLPAWKTFMVGWDGTLFLERATCGSQADTREWEVLTPEGEWLGSLMTPIRNFYLEDGARDRIVAVVADALGVQRVEVHALEIERP